MTRDAGPTGGRQRVDVDAVRAAHPLADVVAAFGVQLVARGHGYMGCCPFHDDSTPSLSVDAVPERFHCFGCGAHGDVIDYVTRLTGQPFREAVQALEDGMITGGRAAARPLTPPARPAAPPQFATTTARAYELNQLAWEHFTRPPAALHAEAYLHHHRRIDVTALRQSVGTPVVGYAGVSWQSLTRHLTAAGATRTESLELDLCHRSRRGDLVDAYRGRLILPVRDQQDRITGFLGRDTTGHPAAPKYRNPSTTPVFDKSAMLYRPAIHQLDVEATVVVVEGPLDALAIAAAAAVSGVDALFAPCSTSGVTVSATQMHNVLEIHPAPLVIALDGDDAGRAGTDRWLRALCLDAGRLALVTSLPEGADPASWLAAAGAAGLAAFDRHHSPGSEADVAPHAPGRELVRMCVDTSSRPNQRVLEAIPPLTAQLTPRMAQQLLAQVTAETTRHGWNPRGSFDQELHRVAHDAPSQFPPVTPSLT